MKMNKNIIPRNDKLQRHGYCKFFLGNILYHKGLFINGNRIGVHKSYYPKEPAKKTVLYNMKDKQPYNDKGQKHGLHELYHEHGHLGMKGTYVNGMREGVFEQYWNNGKLRYSINYTNDKINDLIIEYHLDGSLWVKQKCIHGKVIGYSYQDGRPFKNNQIGLSNRFDEIKEFFII